MESWFIVCTGAEDENSNYDYSNVPMAGLPMIGALMGMCLGGPVGFLAGVKIGGLAAVGGSILGYTGASVVRYVAILKS